MGQIDSGSKSSRLLASRRYTHNTLTAAQESFTNVLDLQASEVYTQASKIPSSELPFSGSSQSGSYYTVGSDNILKYWYRQKLTKSNINNEVWFFLSPSGSSDGVGAQLIHDNQEVNFVSPKYSVASLATSTTEDSTPGYLAVLYKSTSATSGSLTSDDIVSTNDYQFDYKTGVVQFMNSSVDPSNSEYVYMSVNQYVGKTLATGVEISGNISGSVSSTGSFGRLEVAGDGTVAGDLTLGGNITIGDADTDTVSFTADITSNLIPDASDSYNLGSTSKRWNDLYLSGSLSASGGPVDIDSATTVAIDSTTTTAINATTTLTAKGATGASFGDDTGTWEFDGSGAVSETGMTTFSLTPSSTVDVDADGAITIDGASLTVGGDGDTNIIKLTGPVTASTHVSASGNLSATGNLDIDGTANIAGDTTLQSDLSVVDINASGNITGSNNISASGNLYLSGTADIDGNVDIDNTTTTVDSSGGISFDAGATSNLTTSAGDIDINAAANLDLDGATVDIDSVGALSLQGGAASDLTTGAGAITVDGKVGISLKEDGTDVIAIDTNRDVLFSQTGGSTSDPDVEFDGYTRFDGITEVADSTNSTSITTGALVVDGGVGIAKDLVVGGMVTAQEFHSEFVSASIMYSSGSTKFGDTQDDTHHFTGSIDQSGSFNLNTGDLTVNDNTTLKGYLLASGNITGSNNISASGNLYLSGNADIDGTSNFAGDVTLQADLNVSGNITGSSVSASSGAFSTINVDGGTVDGITSLTAGGNLDIGAYDLRAATITADGLTSGRVTFATTNGQLTDDSDLTFSGATLSATYVNATHITASGNISSSGDIFSSGNLDIDGTANVAGIITLQSDLNASGNITGSGNLEISGNISGSVTSTGSFGRIDTTGDIYASGRLYEAGSSVVDHGTAMAIVFGG